VAFPQTPVELLAEMQIGGVWTDITADLYARAPLTIERGRPDEAARVDPSSAKFQLNNRGNEYSPRNPRSVNYGLIGRNTPVRFSVPGTESYLATTGVSEDIVATPDHASLDITSDIDVRVELTASWYQAAQQTLIGKWSLIDGNRSWIFRVVDALALFVWSPTGLSAAAISATFDLPLLPRRAALRATLDVDNGAGGNTATLYWAESLAGPWTLVQTVVTAGTTSIFSGTAPLEIAPTQVTTTQTRLPWRGRLHRAEVRSGIGGSVVASPDVRALSVGTTSWADSAGRTWTVAGAAAVTNREYRLHAEVSSWPPRWDVSGQDVYVPVEASGILRRLGQGTKALASTLRRRIPAVGAPVAYWPLEEGSNAVQGYSPLPGVAPLLTTGFQYAADDSLFGSSALPKIDAAAIMQGTVPTHTATGQWHVAYMYYLPAEPASRTLLLEFTTTGTAKRITFTSEPGLIEMIGYNAAGVSVFTTSIVPSGFHGQWNGLGLTAAETGGNVRYEINWDIVDGAGFVGGTTIAGTAGTVTSINTTFGPLAADMRIGHLGVFASSSTAVYRFGDNGWRGEEAGDRLLRLGAEEGVPITPGYSLTAMGAQRPNALLPLLNECADADLGVLHEDREQLGLVYRPRISLYNQPVVLTLDYAVDGQVAPPLEPVDDDQRIRNDRTVTRVDGSSARVVDETGPLSILPPPNGVGVYDDSRTLNVRYDSQPENIAAWLLHMGTWDEARYPTVHIDLAAAPGLIPDVLALDIGDRIQIINPPTWLPPGPIDLIVEGYTEVIGHPNSWDVILNCSPAGPWTVGVAGSARADTSGSVLGTAASSSATTLVVHTVQTDVGTLPLWTQDPAEFPVDLRVGGEVVTATAATSLAADDFGRTVAAGGWGTASDGHVWTLTGGVSNSERSVASSRGVVTVSASQTLHRQQTVSETCMDCDVRVQMAVSATATGGTLNSCVLLRWSSATNHYRARVEFLTGGTISVSVTSGATIIGSNAATGLSYTPGATFEVRVRIIGYRILMRVWPTGTVEPEVWHIDRTDVGASFASGAVGLSAHGGGGNTNVGVEYRWDSLEVANPQRITVTRSTNGITKAHAAGTDIRLANPAIIAL
jgi:hypothetical protein